MDRSTLREILSNSFNLEELQTLCFDLNIEFEDLRGETKHAKAREVIAYCERVGRIDELITAIYKQRPRSASQHSDLIALPSTKGHYSYDGVAVDLIFNQDGLVINDERELRASLVEALFAAENQLEVSFDVLVEQLEAVKKYIISIESREATPENRLIKISFLRQARVLEEKQKVITATLPLLLLPPIRNHFTSANDLIESLHGLALHLFGSEKSPGACYLDVFKEQDPGMNTVISVDQAEVEQIKTSTGLNIFALIGPGWDLFHLPRETRVRTAIPAIVLQVEQMRSQSHDPEKPFDLLKALDLNSWSIGLH